MEDELKKKKQKISSDILTNARNQILIYLRFMDNAIGNLPYVLEEESGFSTDGRGIIYDPDRIIDMYIESPEHFSRKLLHPVIHCIFRHMFIGHDINRNLWNLATDITVENVINELGINALSGDKTDKQKDFIDLLKGKDDKLTAEHILRTLSDMDIDDRKYQELLYTFSVDDHFWYEDESTSNGSGKKNNHESNKGMSVSNSGKDECGENKKNDDTLASGNSKEEKDLLDSDEGESNIGENLSTEIQEKWKRISENILEDLYSFSKGIGKNAGSFIQNVEALNRDKIDYEQFLKKFAVMKENMVLNNDEFDYIFYTYGLNLYDNVPLIEPLEYKETFQIKEFVIAIDTSGSVNGKIVENFVKKTFSILKDTDTFASRTNIHIIQCDTIIQEDKKITSQEDVDEYFSNFSVKGFGGTDFRPVFSYVDELLQKKEFINLKGLIYFTDGFGVFPIKKPSYKTAFVYLGDEFINPVVPSWAIKAIIGKEDLKEYKGDRK